MDDGPTSVKGEKVIEFFISDTSELPQEVALTIRPLPPQQVEFYARPGHPLAVGHCAFSQVWEFGLASATPPAMMRETLAAAQGQAGSATVPALECDNFAILRAVAFTTDTVVASPRTAVAAEVDAGTLVHLAVKDAPLFVMRPGIALLKGRTLSPMAQCAKKCVEEVANSIFP